MMMLNSKYINKSGCNLPIGIFDSGVGGLTVVRAFEKFLPNESIIYFGDTARYPYGSRSGRIVTEFSVQNAELLVSYGIKMLVVACNTASSVALNELKKVVQIPLTGVIEPGARAAVRTTQNNKIGVIGTDGTISSQSYQNAISGIKSHNFDVYARACPLFVSLAQEGFDRYSDVVDRVGHIYLDGMKDAHVDTLILGCTHYPLLRDSIQRVMGSEVTLIDSAESTVLEISEFLKANNLDNDSNEEPKKRYTVSDSPDKFRVIGERFLKHPIDDVLHIRLR